MKYRVTRNVQVAGLSMQESYTILAANGIPPIEMSLPAAKSGTLSTRTDNDTGVAALGAGHGIITGDKVDVYWIGGRRYGMTVGTVAGTSIPIDGGAGDNLPIATTTVRVSKRKTHPLDFVGSALVAVSLSAAGSGTGLLLDTRQIQFTFVDDSDVVVKNVAVEHGTIWGWDYKSGEPNPFLGLTVAAVYISNGDNGAAQTARIGGLYAPAL